MREPAPMRPSVTRMLAAGRVPALLVALSLGASGVPLVAAAAESVEQDRQKEAHPTPRWAHAAAVLDGKIYVMGGAGADNEPISRVEVYDPATDTWGVCAGIPTPRGLFGASTVGGKIYAVGGTTMGLDSLAVVEAYHPATDTWTRGEDMPTPRSTMTVSAFGGRIYAIGGGVRPEEQDVAVSLMEVYDTATGRWAAAADMPTPRFVPSSGVINGRIYVTGGATSHGPASSQEERTRSRMPLSVVEVYDPASGRWTTDADLTTPRGWLSTSVMDGKLYVIGGRSLAPAGGIVEVDGAIPGLEVYTPTQ